MDGRKCALGWNGKESVRGAPLRKMRPVRLVGAQRGRGRRLFCQCLGRGKCRRAGRGLDSKPIIVLRAIMRNLASFPQRPLLLRHRGNHTSIMLRCDPIAPESFSIFHL
jgi:hypothetical protein